MFYVHVLEAHCGLIKRLVILGPDTSEHCFSVPAAYTVPWGTLKIYTYPTSINYTEISGGGSQAFKFIRKDAAIQDHQMPENHQIRFLVLNLGRPHLKSSSAFLFKHKTSLQLASTVGPQ